MEATGLHRSLAMNSRAIKAPQLLPQLVLSVMPAQYFRTHVQGEQPGSFPLVISLAINAQLIESISHEDPSLENRCLHEAQQATEMQDGEQI